jgi:hypothetical protein
MADLNALQNDGVALAHADAHRDQRVALAGLSQISGSG